MNRLLILLTTTLLACLPSGLMAQAEDAPTALAHRMVLSEMKRNPDPVFLDFGKKPRWSYVVGIELDAMLDVWFRTHDERIMQYLCRYVDEMIDTEGNITGYRYEDFNLDNVRPAHFLYRFHQLRPRPHTALALQTLYRQLDHQPRTEEGVYWHKAIYHDQVWLDGIFMGLPFRTQAAPSMVKGDELEAVYDDVVNQISITFDRTYDARTGLWKHAWDSRHTMFWANPETGLSQHSWARAMGWFCMALTEVLDALPQDYHRRTEVVRMLRRAMKAVVAYQQRGTGVWNDVLDVEDERNYTEATASAMFAYCLLKGVNKGYLSSDFRQAGRQAYEGVVREFLREGPDSTLVLTRCSEVSGLGPENNPRRDGSFNYYISEPIRDNDGKGIGPFIWASLER